MQTHAQIQQVLSGGSKFDNIPIFFFSFFLVDEGIDHPNTTINGPSSARQQNAI